ncbi:MAG: membrane protein insertase YidC [Thermomicrobiales bacterium]|nr:membrane protein insertase YidC [Thermomicrobiales bacterium]
MPVWDQYVQLLEWALNGLAGFFHSGGIAIVAFTIIIKTLLLPLTVQSIRSSKAMQELQPKIKELQKKHGKDRQRISQETMLLYQQHRVNPMAGCLPMIVQIPVFFGLYSAIRNLATGGVGIWSEPFLWLPHLNSPDPWHILPILAAVFQFVQTKMMRPSGQGKASDPQQAMMNSMMNFMPLTVILFGWNFAAGPVIYWATQSAYSVVQQWLITGWGSLLDWVPGLPDLPEHKRLGYRPPTPLEDMVVMAGEGGQAVQARGFSGWMQRQMERAQQLQTPPPEPEPEPEPTPARAQSGKGGKKSRGQQATGKLETAGETAGADDRAASNGKAVIVPRKVNPGGQ